MRNTLLITAAIGVCLGIGHARAESPPECKGLVAYRDKQLVRDWEIAVGRYEAFSQGRAILADIKRDLNSQQFWNSDIRGSIGLIVGPVKLASNVILNGLGIAMSASPGGQAILKASDTVTGAVASTAQQAAQAKQRAEIANNAYKVIKTYKDANKFKNATERDIAEIVGKIVLSNGGPVSRSVKLLLDLKSDSAEVMRVATDRQNLQHIFLERISAVDRDVAALQQRMTTALARIDYVNGVREGIDRYCSLEQKPEPQPQRVRQPSRSKPEPFAPQPIAVQPSSPPVFTPSTTRPIEGACQILGTC